MLGSVEAIASYNNAFMKLEYAVEAALYGTGENAWKVREKAMKIRDLAFMAGRILSIYLFILGLNHMKNAFT